MNEHVREIVIPGVGAMIETTYPSIEGASELIELTWKSSGQTAPPPLRAKGPRSRLIYVIFLYLILLASLLSTESGSF